MSVIDAMMTTAVECARTPGRISIWSDSLGKYVCSADPEFESVMAEQGRSSRPVINPAFKLVFLTSAGGTALFVIICVVTTLMAGKDPPPLLDKTISSLFDLAKIGFGAVAGLLGGHALQQNLNPDTTR
jgi:hypothetical protein